MAKILILGETGQVATALRDRLSLDAHEVKSVGRRLADLGDPVAARAVVLEHSPDVVINAAAYTAVDKAESEPEAARALNVDGPAAAAAAAAEISAPFIHFSTDYVFDGSGGRPYTESDPTNPLGVYGQTKLDGERMTAAANPRHVILRTSWVCSPTGSNFMKTMLRLAAERDFLGVVSDQHGRPTFARDLANVVALLIPQLPDSEDDARWGVFHATGQGDTTWYSFASAIMEESRARGGPATEIRPISTADYPTPSRRPADSRLANDKLDRIYGVRLPEWRESLTICLDEIYGLTGKGHWR